jgi:hypothetical protein
MPAAKTSNVGFTIIALVRLISYRYANVTKKWWFTRSDAQNNHSMVAVLSYIGTLCCRKGKKMTLSAEGFPIFEYLCSIIAIVI